MAPSAFASLALHIEIMRRLLAALIDEIDDKVEMLLLAGEIIELHQRQLDFARLPLDQLIALPAYPTDQAAVTALYQTSEKLVRYLFTGFPAEAFPRFVDALLGGASFPDAVMKIYGDRAGSYENFVEGFNRFET